MIIHFIGPGGAGKSTLAQHIHLRANLNFFDLDECFMSEYGDISAFIDLYGYSKYATVNVELYEHILKMIAVGDDAIIVCSSGFMTYHLSELCPQYKTIKHEIEQSKSTILFLPALAYEPCIAKIIERQLQRTYLKTSFSKENIKIRNRIDYFLHLECRIFLTAGTLGQQIDDLFRIIQDMRVQTI